jgi:uncharacterized membrane protein YeaQ/YmgE (transglycosylase-associated protein family)
MSTTENMSRIDLVAKLKTILDLYQNTQQVQEQMDNFQPEDHYVRKVKVPQFPGTFRSEEEREAWRDKLDHLDDDAIETAEQVHRKFYAPKEPEKPRLKEFQKINDKELQNKQSQFGCLSQVAAGIAGFFVLGALLNLNDEYGALPTILIIAAIAVAAFFFFKSKAKAAKAAEDIQNANALLAHNRQQEEIMAEYNEKMKVYQKETAAYEVALQDFLAAYALWLKDYIASEQEEERIADQLEEERQAEVRKIYEEKMLPAKAALNKANDLVSEEYLPVLNILIKLIESSRADDLKEAINLYEDLVYRERQLQLQREQEEQRQREEEQRRQDEERRHREEMKFRKDQERQRQYEEEQRRQDEERRHREETKFREDQERQRRHDEEQRRREQLNRAREEREQKAAQWNAANAQCRACAYAATCDMKIHNRTPNCTGFRPR